MLDFSIQLFGAFQVKMVGQPIKQFRGNKVRALLAYLVTAGDTPLLRSDLAALLWDGYMEKTALTSLRSALTNLRQILAPLPLIETSRQTVRFHTRHPALWCDVVAVQQWIEQAGVIELQAWQRLAPGVNKQFLQGLPLIDSAPFQTWRARQQAYYQQQIAQCMQQMDISVPSSTPPALS